VGDTKVVDMTFPDSNKYTAKVLASDIFFTGDTGYTLPINTNATNAIQPTKGVGLHYLFQCGLNKDSTHLNY